jgi:hypothetical protein
MNMSPLLHKFASMDLSAIVHKHKLLKVIVQKIEAAQCSFVNDIMIMTKLHVVFFFSGMMIKRHLSNP